MQTKVIPSMIAFMLLLGSAPALEAAEPGSPDVAKNIAALQEMCDGSAEARTARHAASALYDRLGGMERIQALTTEIVRLHARNPEIQHVLQDVSHEALAKRVGDFMAAGTGGPNQYSGRNMVHAHSHLALTDADFLSAGGDVIQAMNNLGYGQEEIDEVVCILMSMKDQVVLR